MKKSLLALLTVSLALAGAAFGADQSYKRQDLIERVETCEAILREFQADPKVAVPASVLHAARAIIVVNQFKGGFIFGIQDGYGTIMVKRSDGSWSVPALVQAGEASFGLQLGAKAVETVYIITDENTPKLIFNQRFNIGVDAKAVAGPNDAATEKATAVLTAPVLVYTRATGLYAGATLKTGWIARHDAANFVLYNTTHAMPELLYSNWVHATPEVQPFIDYVKQIAR